MGGGFPNSDLRELKDKSVRTKYNFRLCHFQNYNAKENKEINDYQIYLIGALLSEGNYYDGVKLAKIEKRLVEGTIYECPRYTAEDIEKYAERAGGASSISFRREYLNEMITDQDSAVIPEASACDLRLFIALMYCRASPLRY